MTWKKFKRINAAPVHSDYAPEIAALLRGELAPGILREKLCGYHEGDLAAALEWLTADERARLYRVLGREKLAGVLERAGSAGKYLGELGFGERAGVLGAMEPASAVEYLRGLDRSEREALLELMDADERAGIVLLGSFDADEIGAHMTTNFVAVRLGMGVREAMRSLIDQAAEHDNISTVYVTDADGEFCGAIDLKQLIIARDGDSLESITSTNYPYVYAAEPVSGCIERLTDYSEDSVPVLDDSNRLCGVLTSQELARLTDRELSEDYARLGGLSNEEDLNEPLRRSVHKRLPWLLVLLGLGLVVSSVVGAFEHVVERVALVVSFQSLVLDMAGNVGTQSLAVTIRVLMDKNVTGREKFRLLLKECRVGLVVGAALCVLAFGFIGLYLMVFKAQAPLTAFAVSLCTGVAMLVSIILSSASGTLIPIFFDKLHIDPAVASGPLITTVNDLIAVVAYYGLAWILLINVLGM